MRCLPEARQTNDSHGDLVYTRELREIYKSQPARRAALLCFHKVALSFARRASGRRATMRAASRIVLRDATSFRRRENFFILNASYVIMQIVIDLESIQEILRNWKKMRRKLLILIKINVEMDVSDTLCLCYLLNEK